MSSTVTRMTWVPGHLIRKNLCPDHVFLLSILIIVDQHPGYGIFPLSFTLTYYLLVPIIFSPCPIYRDLLSSLPALFTGTCYLLSLPYLLEPAIFSPCPIYWYLPSSLSTLFTGTCYLISLSYLPGPATFSLCPIYWSLLSYPPVLIAGPAIVFPHPISRSC